MSRYLSGTQLPSLLHTVGLSTLVLFSALLVVHNAEAVWGDSEAVNVLTDNFKYFAFLLLRLYHKVSIAQDSTNQVHFGLGYSRDHLVPDRIILIV